jgi:uncharacterized protein YkwD
MKTSSATGRRVARRPGPRGPAKIIVFPAQRIVRRRRWALRMWVAVVVVAVIAATGAGIYFTRIAAHLGDQIATMSGLESEVAQLINGERVRNGLKPVALSPRVAVMARAHSYDMAIRHYQSRNSPEGMAPADRARGVAIQSKKVDENVYVDHGDIKGLPARAFAGWLKNDPQSRAILLSPDFEQTGVGIARSSDGYSYVTEDFVL